jgi:ketosteroid isomerase-like protein
MAALAPMAVAIAWLGAYRDKALEPLIDLYDDDAIQSCGCDGQKVIAGTQALRAYWIDRFRSRPAYGLAELRAEADGVSVSYWTNNSVVQARLRLNDRGKIAHIVCGPEDAQIRPMKSPG